MATTERGETYDNGEGLTQGCAEVLQDAVRYNGILWSLANDMCRDGSMSYGEAVDRIGRALEMAAQAITYHDFGPQQQTPA